MPWCVCLPAVVDSHTFIQDYSSRSTLAARPDLGDGGNLRPVVDLLVEQIEWVPGQLTVDASLFVGG